MRKSFIRSFFAAVCMAALAVTSVSASDIRSESEIRGEMEAVREENERRQKEIEALGGDVGGNEEAMRLISEQIDGVNKEIEKYRELIKAKESEINGKLAEIDTVEKSMLEKEREIDLKRSDIARLNAENKENLAKFAKLARVLYMNDVSDKIPVLNGSSDWFEYFVYSDVVSNIGKQNYDFMKRLADSIRKQEELIGELNTDIDELQSARDKLEAEKAELDLRVEELTAERTELEKAAKEKRDYLLELTAENEELRDRIASLESDIAKGNAALDALNDELEARLRADQENQPPDQPVYGGELRWPLDSNFRYITTYFGYDAEMSRIHKGIDVGNSGIRNANIYAMQSGTVHTVVNYCLHNYGGWGKNCGCGGGFGNYIIIDHGGGLATLYAHCGSINVYEGQHVDKGDVIGSVGSTGWSTGFHLHFEVREYGTRVDPFNYL